MLEKDAECCLDYVSVEIKYICFLIGKGLCDQHNSGQEL